ncbi:FAD-dependent oxidoreductase [Thauera sp. SWB20]|uniref:FAD-dependent oxidoreductase n=1 Tax=Thauera sp. SWB20 TaxID=1572758 RepID=UPI0005AE104C|nr:bifunctional TVP38/TMEM64 family protein/FAD-dependent oxidoreductase [Thauera sp. SWB20]KIN90950.1 3-hydroxyacyl-CoA dehydrogenase, NAD binding domain protein [Thauera sp. SWB20]
MKKPLLLLLVLALVAGFFASGLHRQLDLDTLKAGMAGFAAWREASPVLVAALYFAAYVAVTALSLPGAAVMTLAGGALFGLGWGLLIVSFASTIGATLAFLVSRHLLRDSVHARFGARLRAIDEGIARDGAFYLFSLRLVPAFPFFLINLLMGLTPIRTRTFYWVSQLGMLPGTLVYVNAGTELGAVDSLAGVLSPGLVASFVLLGLFPLLARWMVERVQARRVYAGWQRPARFERNLVVIGAGAAGLVTSYIAAAVKAKVTLVEAGRMGGDCLNTGCVPSKALIRSARLAHQIRHADRYGLEPGEPEIDFRRLMARVRAVIRKIEPHDSVERYSALGVEVLQGRARIVDPWTVEVALNEGGTRRLSTRSIVIATGARPTVPDLPGLEAVGYLTSDTVWDAFAALDAPPRRLLVLGGGPIGCELAQACARLGSQVVLVARAPQLLPREDADVGAFARAALEADGVEVLTGVAALRCEQETAAGGTDKFLVVADPASGGERRIAFDTLLCAVGRSARLEGFGLEALGIPTGATVATDDFLQTRYPNILAAGDVAGPLQFTHVAAHQAWHAAVNALFGHLRRFRVDYRCVPHTTFTDPEVARVGLNETEARARGIAFEFTRYDLAELDRAITDGADRGFVKVLTVPGKDRILGATIVGEHAGELLAEFVLAMKHGLGLNKLLGTIHAYPTFAEANKSVAGEWKRAHAPQRVLRWLERHHAWRRG